MTKIQNANLILFLASATFLILIGGLTFAQNEDPFAALTYPIKELGNCANRDACEVYCEKPENMAVCLNFAETHNLIPKEEIEMGRKMLALGETTGPGGCRGQKACEAYCDNVDHIKECIIFAEKHNLIPQEELGEAKKVLAAVEKGLKPPKCKGKRDCDVYCSEPENMGECITFGEAAGLIPPEELQDAKKALEAIRKGVKPPRCKGRAECDVYCSSPEHMEECINFGIAAGFIPPEEQEDAKKMLEALKKGVKPPNCRGREECDVYCQTAEHMEECMDFAIAAGFMPPEEIENAKKTLEALKKGVKPPNCRGKEECDLYCSQAEHMAECMEFGIAAGFMPPEEVENAKKMLEAIKRGVKPPNCRGEEECQVYCSQPEHMAECMEFALAAGHIPPEEAENTRRMLEAIKKGVNPPNCRGEEECQMYCSQPEHRDECINFSEAAGFMTPEEAQRAREGGGAGPGGCKSQEECEAYCQVPEHREECIGFAEKMGEMTPEEAERARQNTQLQQQGGPGGCRTPEECEAYCQDPSHMRECIEFGVRAGQFTPEQAQEMLQQIEMRERGEMMGPSPEAVVSPPPPEEQASPPEAIGEPLPPSGEQMPPGGVMPPEGIMPPPEETITPPPAEIIEQQPPQSFLDAAKQFLANILAIFGLR